MKSKYIKPQHETYRRGNQVCVAGAPKGPTSDEFKHSLIYPQAQIVIAKFGGPRELARAIKAICTDPKDHIDPSTIYRWMYPPEKGGTGGRIPGPALTIILKIARRAGVKLLTEEIYPNIIPGHRPEEESIE